MSYKDRQQRVKQHLSTTANIVDDDGSHASRHQDGSLPLIVQQCHFPHGDYYLNFDQNDGFLPATQSFIKSPPI